MALARGPLDTMRGPILQPMKSLRGRSARGGGYSHTLPIRVCAAQRGRDFEAPGLERGIHFRGVFYNGV